MSRARHRLWDARRRDGWHCRIDSAGRLVSQWRGRITLGPGLELCRMYLTDYAVDPSSGRFTADLSGPPFGRITDMSGAT